MCKVSDKSEMVGEIIGWFDMELPFCLVPRNNMFHMHAKFQVCSSGQFLNQLWTNKQTKSLSFTATVNEKLVLASKNVLLYIGRGRSLFDDVIKTFYHLPYDSIIK